MTGRSTVEVKLLKFRVASTLLLSQKNQRYAFNNDIAFEGINYLPHFNNVAMQLD